MILGLRGIARGEGDTRLSSSLPEDSGTHRTPFFRLQRPWGARRLLDELSAQQTSLVRAVVLDDAGYLNRSFYLDQETGKRVAHEVDRKEVCQFTDSWESEPAACIRRMNQAIGGIGEVSRRERYLRAAVDLEILMDRQSWPPQSRKVYQGIPKYLMNGYTDMGSLSSVTARNGREKIKVDKQRVRARLVACKRRVVSSSQSPEAVLGHFYEAVRREVKFNEVGVEKLFREYGDQSIVLSKYLDMGLGVCRHLSIFYQIYLQEAGIESRLVKGDLKFFVFSGRHAWNLARVGKRVALVDVTHPNVARPFIVIGSSEEEVYKRACETSRSYVATPNDQNHYKIGM